MENEIGAAGFDEVKIIAELKAKHLRTPEIVTIQDETDENLDQTPAEATNVEKDDLLEGIDENTEQSFVEVEMTSEKNDHRRVTLANGMVLCSTLRSEIQIFHQLRINSESTRHGGHETSTSIPVDKRSSNSTRRRNSSHRSRRNDGYNDRENRHSRHDYQRDNRNSDKSGGHSSGHRSHRDLDSESQRRRNRELAEIFGIRYHRREDSDRDGHRHERNSGDARRRSRSGDNRDRHRPHQRGHSRRRSPGREDRSNEQRDKRSHRHRTEHDSDRHRRLHSSPENWNHDRDHEDRHNHSRKSGSGSDDKVK